jgi:hypothetical protein
MRLALTALLFIFLTGCADSPNADKDPSPTAASTSEADALDQTCAKIARTWAVAADKLHTSLTLADMDSVDSTTGAMRAASDQMKIEQCEGEMVDKALEGNYVAAVAATDALLCSREPEISVCPAGKAWRSEGEPIVARVWELAER